MIFGLKMFNSILNSSLSASHHLLQYACCGSHRSNSLEGYGNESEKGFHLKLVIPTDVPFSTLIKSHFQIFTQPRLHWS